MKTTNKKTIGWTQITLGEVATVKHGFAFSGEGITDIENENILLTPGNFEIGGGWKYGKKFFTGEIPTNYLLNTGDLVVTMTDLSKGGDTLGYPALIPNNPSKKFLHNQRIGLVNINGKVDKEFIFYLLKWSNYQKYIVNSATGSTVRHTSPTKILDFEFAIPPLPEQHAIAAVLSSLDDKIELLREQNKVLEETAQSIFKEWFGKYSVERPEELPEGWRVGRLGEEFEISIGRTPPRGETQWFSNTPTGKKWISIKDIGNSGVYIFNSTEYLTDEAVKKFNIPVIPQNTTILSFKMTVGKLSITTEEMLSNEAIAHLKIKNDSVLTSEFIYCSLQSLDFNSLGSTSSIVTAINSMMIKQIEIIVPGDVTLKKFNRAIKPLFEKIFNNSSQIQILSTLRDSLLPRLMRGDVRVKIF